VPTAYFYQAIPNTVMQTLIVYFYIAMNVNPRVSGIAVSLLYLPWFIKPLWGPIVDILRTKKWWSMWMQIAVGIGFVAVALIVPATGADTGRIFAWTLIPFVLIALCAATYDVASDGMYMINLDSNQQSVWVGLRATAFRIGWLLVDGGMLWLVGWLAGEGAEPLSGGMMRAWQVAFFVLAAITFATAAYNRWAFPQDKPRVQGDGKDVKSIVREFGSSIATFFEKPGILWGVLFLVFYRTGEAQLLQILPSFFTDSVAGGGLAIPMEAQGLIKGTVGVIALILGGIAGGFAIARKGLRFWLLPMILILNLPNLGYVLLAMNPGAIGEAGAAGLAAVGGVVALGYFGYGFSFTSYTMYMVYISRGRFATSHYAICSGLMALSLIWPKAVSGFSVTLLGYEAFFWMVVILGTLPSVLLYRRLGVDGEFGKTTDK
jgi:PAT family beta-lactamase induction signal transducer AmpG